MAVYINCTLTLNFINLDVQSDIHLEITINHNKKVDVVVYSMMDGFMQVMSTVAVHG